MATVQANAMDFLRWLASTMVLKPVVELVRPWAPLGFCPRRGSVKDGDEDDDPPPLEIDRSLPVEEQRRLIDQAEAYWARKGDAHKMEVARKELAKAVRNEAAKLTPASKAKAAKAAEAKKAQKTEAPGRTTEAKLETVLDGAAYLFKLGELEDAQQGYEKAIEIAPKDIRPYRGLIEAKQKQDQHLSAFSTAKRGHEANPNNPEFAEMVETCRQQYKNRQEEKRQTKEKVLQRARDKAAGKEVSDDDKENKENLSEECPGTKVAAAMPKLPSNNWNGRIVPVDERRHLKECIMKAFRKEWDKLSKSKAAQDARDTSVKTATKEYSTEQQMGLTIKGGHQPMERPDHVDLPEDYRRPVGMLTLKELKKYGCHSQRILISVYGDIFDVSDRPDKYDENGPYYYFAGRDVTWGLLTGRDDEDCTNKFYDVFKMEDRKTKQKMQIICSWLAFYEVEYGEPIGHLDVFDKEPELPAPPTGEEQCVVQ